MKMYGGADILIHTFLVSALSGSGQLHAPVALPPRERVPLNRMLGGPQEPVCTTWSGEKCCSHWDLNPDSSAVHPVAGSVVPALTQGRDKDVPGLN
jgi:hypothetical protein